MAVMVALLIGSPRQSVADSVSGPNSAFASAQNVFFPDADTPILTATITSGKAGRVLVVTATIVDYINNAGTNQTYYYVPRVSSPLLSQQYMEPTGPSDYALAKVNSSSGVFPFGTMVSSGQWWLDLDEYPGLINQPLTIQLFGSSYPTGPALTREADVGLSAIMQLK